MHTTILDKIVQDKAKWIAQQKQQQPLADFQAALRPATRDFYQALRTHRPAFILECKKASPSKGVIRQDFDPASIASVYRKSASVVSVLTDETYFAGRFAYLDIVSRTLHQPVLCKDFIIDPYQIYLARYHGADAILLMLSVLTNAQYQQLAAVATRLSMGILTEVSNALEVERAIQLGAPVVGINNRDLRDLSVNLDKTRQLAALLPKDTVKISESGINSLSTIRDLQQYVDGFLIGSSLMAETNLAQAVDNLLFGQHKVCGLTRTEDVQAAWQAGAGFAGLIFVDGSPRQVSIEQAATLMTQAPLRYVGVFRNQPIEQVAMTAEQLGLFAVQLHGDEDTRYLAALRKELPQTVEIWKAFSITASLPQTNWRQVDRYLFDNAAGGSGQCFDWSLLAQAELAKVMLAGGINPENCQQANSYHPLGLDINSGVEQAPGIKDPQRLQQIFQTLQSSLPLDNRKNS
jgi:indole-3-glycerol phosphate synthase / phosphoribosylanthranilate isomerase